MLVRNTLLQCIDIEDVEAIIKVALIFDGINIVSVLTSVVSDCITRSNGVNVSTFYSIEIVVTLRLV